LKLAKLRESLATNAEEKASRPLMFSTAAMLTTALSRIQKRIEAEVKELEAKAN
jgi:hypothetical protein